MALLIIKKKPATPKVAEPSPIVEPVVAKHLPPNTWKDLPVASSIEELWNSRGTLRPAEPTACRLCGNSYPYPCHGLKDTCMNKKFAEGRSDANNQKAS